MIKPCSLLLFLFLFPSFCLAADCNDFPAALQEASKIRKLAVKKAVPCVELGREDFLEQMKSLYTEDLESSRLKLTEKTYKMSGFLPEDYNYTECYFKGSSQAIGAFYHPKRKKVFIPKSIETSFDVLVHEAVHALQDQHYEIDKIAKKANKFSDSALAFAAVIEGDAESVQYKYLEKNNSKKTNELSSSKKDEKEDSCALPQALLFQVEFPYSWGSRYAFILNKKDPGLMPQRFKNMPRSTTEILYPKYKLHPELKNSEIQEYKVEDLLKKFPYEIELLPAVYTDTWGEYSLRCLLRQYLGSKKAVFGAKGWLHDQITLSPIKSAPDKYLLSWITKWENLRDSKEFYLALLESFEKRFSTTLRKQTTSVLFSTEKYPHIFLKQEQNLVYVFISQPHP